MAEERTFNPQRLTIARQYRGLTKVGLANAANLSPRTVSQYESGNQTPPENTIQQLATHLSFPRAFFAGDDLTAPAIESTSFRALSRMTRKTRDRALSIGTTALALSDWIDHRFKTPSPNVPQFQTAEPDTAAAALRRYWGLGQQPLPNLMHLAEANGIRLFSLPHDLIEVDAYSFWLDNRPFIFLNTHKSAEHTRMDIAHELGHLTMHWQGISRSRTTEQDAQQFGSSFLMPEKDIIGNCPYGATLPQIIALKERWGISVAALAYRLHKLHMISDWRYRSLFIEISKQGYRRLEPLPRAPEQSAILRQVLQIHEQDGHSRADIAAELAITLDDLHDVTFGLAPQESMSTSPVRTPTGAHSVTADNPNLRVIRGEGAG